MSYPPGQSPGQPPGQSPGQPPPYGYQQQQPRGSGLAITALILGIVALLSSWTVVGGLIFGFAALIVGFLASGRAKRGVAGGRGMAITGIVLGLLSLVVAGIVAFFIGSFFTSDGVQSLRQCIESANGDQARIDQCRRDFERELVS